MSVQTPETPAQKPTPCGIVRDGYTIPFTIPEVPGYSVGLSGLRRPMTERQLQNFLASIREENNKPPSTLPKNMTAYEWTNSRIEDARSKGLAAQIFEWDLVDEKGESVPITAENVARLHPPELMAKLLSVLCGFDDREKAEAADEKN